MKTNQLQYFIDPIDTKVSESLEETAATNNMTWELEFTSLIYRSKPVPVYRVSEKLFKLIYSSRKSILGKLGVTLRFFTREGEDGPVSLKNAREMKEATKRVVNRSIALILGKKKVSEGYHIAELKKTTSLLVAKLFQF